MRKLKYLTLTTIFLITAIVSKAQTKTGFIDVSEVIVLMPEFKKSDTMMLEYQTALGDQYDDMVRELNNKDSLLASSDTLKMSRTQLEMKRKDLGLLYVKVQGWNQSAQQLYNEKQNELLRPVQEKALKAIDDVAKENGYRSVLNKNAFVVLPPEADNLLPLVKKKLRL